MPDAWPPDGYSDPEEYESSNWRVYLIAAFLLPVMALPTLSSISVGVGRFVTVGGEIAQSLGLPPFAGGLFAGLVLVIIILGSLKHIVVPVHEWLHYTAGRILDINPEYTTVPGLVWDDPAVVPASRNIPVWKNMVMLMTPVTVIGVVAAVAMYAFSSWIALAGAIVLWGNTASSCQDIYHYLNLARMHPEARFANFKDGDGYRTEYVVPLE